MNAGIETRNKISPYCTRQGNKVFNNTVLSIDIEVAHRPSVKSAWWKVKHESDDKNMIDIETEVRKVRGRGTRKFQTVNARESAHRTINSGSGSDHLRVRIQRYCPGFLVSTLCHPGSPFSSPLPLQDLKPDTHPDFSPTLLASHLYYSIR